MQQQRDNPYPDAIANTSAHTRAHSFTDTCTYPYSNSDTVPNSEPFAHTCSNSHAYPDPFTCHSSLGSPIQRPCRRC